MKRILIGCCLLTLATACMKAPQPAATPGSGNATDRVAAAATWQEVTDQIPSDPVTLAVIQPYRDQLNAEMDRIIGTAQTDLTKGGAESTLGNFVTDVMLETARKFTDVDCAVTNSGGLRSPIFKGDITIGSVFQLMPFENQLVVARFSGADFVALVREIAEKGGEPVSGLTIVSTNGIVTAYVGEEPVVDYRDYTVATIDYLLKGGGRLEAMGRGKLVQDTGVLLREALIDYVEREKQISAKLEGRVIIQ